MPFPTEADPLACRRCTYRDYAGLKVAWGLAVGLGQSLGWAVCSGWAGFILHSSGWGRLWANMPGRTPRASVSICVSTPVLGHNKGCCQCLSPWRGLTSHWDAPRAYQVSIFLPKDLAPFFLVILGCFPKQGSLCVGLLRAGFFLLLSNSFLGIILIVVSSQQSQVL